MESIVSALTQIVPQIAYDIIGRFVPGTIVIFSWAIVLWPTLERDLRDKLQTYSPNGWSILLFLLVAYVLSSVLYGVWRLVNTLVRHFYKPQRPDKKPLFSIEADSSSDLTKGRLSDDFRLAFSNEWVSLSTNVTITPEKPGRQWRVNDIGLRQTYIVERKRGKLRVYHKKYPSESLMYDAIRVKSPGMGANIVKLRAEALQAQVLITGWIIACILNLPQIISIGSNSCSCLVWRENSRERFWLEMILIAGILGVYKFNKRIKSNCATSIKNHWRILQLDQEPWFAAPSGGKNERSKSRSDRPAKRKSSTQV